MTDIAGAPPWSSELPRRGFVVDTARRQRQHPLRVAGRQLPVHAVQASTSVRAATSVLSWLYLLLHAYAPAVSVPAAPSGLQPTRQKPHVLAAPERPR